MNHVYHQVRNLIIFSLLFVQLIISSFPGYAGRPENAQTTNVRDSISLPVIFSFTPTSGTKGSPIVILGSHFTGTTAVHFGGTSAASFAVISDTAIFASVGSGSSGNISVTTPNGTASKAGFVFIGADSSVPVISFFTPTSGRRGAPVAIIGSHFIGTTAVRFGGTVADSFFVVSDSAIVAQVGAGSSGSVAVTTPFGTASKPGFTFISDTTIVDTAAPVMYNFSPPSGRSGDFVTIIGSHFIGTTAVRFGGTVADSFFVVSESAIVAQVGAGSSGSVAVTTPFGTASKPGFTFISDTTIVDTAAPVMYNFSPPSGRSGDFVTIIGSHLGSTTAVRFGGTVADSFFVISDSAIVAQVGAGSSGSVAVTTPFGTASKPGFTFISDTTIVDTAAPVMYNFSPPSGRSGDFVTIIGSHLGSTTAVRFGGTLADSFFVVSDSAIVAQVGAGSSGNVVVTTPFGTASKPGFTFISDTTIVDTAAPVIVSFTPTVGRKGTVVAIFGSHFTETTAVRFGGIPADSFAVQSDSIILAVVDTGSTGSVSVTTPFGTASKPGFTFILDSTITDTTIILPAIPSNETRITKATVSLYPNPASGYAILTHPATAHPARVQVVDLMGKVVRSINAGSNTEQTKINTTGLVPGMYKVIWNNGAKSVTQTLLVNNN